MRLTFGTHPGGSGTIGSAKPAATMNAKTGCGSEPELPRVRQPWGADIGLDIEVANKTRGDLQLLVTRAYPAFALPVDRGT
jgi:hypothetical protein